jgi:cellulose synthase/poly-beta-1,6-N-acetylglucosamine synthase-like glycosyltransferase
LGDAGQSENRCLLEHGNVPKSIASVTQPVPLTVVVLTYNEERNLSACLESVAGWAGEIFVVDSGSTDHTVEIAERHGARVVTHSFESHAKQWNWALHYLPFT